MKRKILLIILGVLLFVPIIVSAKGTELSVNGPDKASVNERIDYTLVLNSSEQITGFETNVKYDTSVLELVSITKKDNWSGNNSIKNNGNDNIIFTNSGVTGESNIVTLRFRVKSYEKNNTTISFEGTKATSVINSESNESENVISTVENIKKDIIIKSDDNTLKTIKIDGKQITGFKASVYSYTLEVDALTDSIKLDASLNNSQTASFIEKFGPRTINLNYGNNEVLIKTKSESEKEATYKIIIIRKDDRVANNDLKSIIINGGDIKINFDKSVLTYTIKTYKLEKIEVEAVADDTTSVVEVDAPSKLVIGENKVRITVTAVTNDVKTYNLLIVNSEVPTDTRLRNLAIKGVNLGFNNDTYKYTVRYDKSYKNGVKLYYTSLSNDVDIKVVGNSRLKPGSKINVIVESLDGSSSSQYTITFIKDSRINFFFIIDILVGVVAIVLIIIQLNKRKKKKLEQIKVEEELEKTKELKL